MFAALSRRESFSSSPSCKSLKRAVAAIAIGTIVAAIPAVAQKSQNDRDHNRFFFWPGNLVVSRSVYDNNPNNVQVGAILPPGCANTQGGCGAASGAPNNGTYPFVWNNDTY